MAVLTNQERAVAARRLGNRLFVENNQTATLDHDQLLATVVAVDDWIEANAAGLNAAIPQPMRGTMTPPQKAELLAYVALKRTGAI